MTDTILVLGQSFPAVATLTTLYTVPMGTSATISSIMVCNTTGLGDSFRVSVAPGGAGDTLSQYIYYNLPMDANDTFMATLGMTLAATDVVRVYSSGGNLAFSLFGVQLT